jgi:hypothetical protein
MITTKKEAAEAWRHQQAERLLELFEAATGRHAPSLEELVRWVKSSRGREIIKSGSNDVRSFVGRMSREARTFKQFDL